MIVGLMRGFVGKDKAGQDGMHMKTMKIWSK